MKSPRRKKWFRHVRKSYIPISWQGWISYVPFIALLLLVIQLSYNDMQSSYRYVDNVFISAVLHLAICVVPSFVFLGVVMTWLAIKKS